MTRQPLNVHRIVAAAAEVADDGGIGAVSMRSVARRLGVEAMSLYHHVTGKDAILDAMVEHVFAQVQLPSIDDPWRPAMTTRAESARVVLSRHPWGLGLVESRRSPGPATLRHHDTVLGCLRHNGFSVELASHAFSAIDSYVYGFVVTEVNLPFEAGENAEDFVYRLALSAAEYPHLVEMARVRVIGQEYAYADEFGYGLDLILDALRDRLGDADRSRSG